MQGTSSRLQLICSGARITLLDRGVAERLGKKRAILD